MVAPVDGDIVSGTYALDARISDWNTTSVRNGTYRVESLAFDPEGNAGPRDGVTITIEN